MFNLRGSMTVAVTASLLAACNSTDSLYSRGPWGPPHVHRDYPRYSSPWNGWNAEFVEVSPAPLGRPGIFADRAFGTSYEVTEVVHLEASLPPGPNAPLQELVLDSAPALGPPPFKSIAPITPPPPLQATLPAGANPPGVFSAPKRASSYAGTWKVAVSGRSTCSVKLTSVPALDLYKASASGCGGKLQGVNAWSFRDGTVILFSRGNVVARLSGEEASLSGHVDGSGEPLRLSR